MMKFRRKPFSLKVSVAKFKNKKFYNEDIPGEMVSLVLCVHKVRGSNAGLVHRCVFSEIGNHSFGYGVCALGNAASFFL